MHSSLGNKSDSTSKKGKRKKNINQTPHALTHKWVLSNENTWTQGGEHHTLGPVKALGGYGSDSRGLGESGEIAL